LNEAIDCLMKEYGECISVTILLMSETEMQSCLAPIEPSNPGSATYFKETLWLLDDAGHRLKELEMKINQECWRSGP